jgi:hypothetical protein
VGNLLAGRGEVGAALEHYTRSLHLAEQLAGADPDNPAYQRDVAVSLERVGDLLAGRGEVGAALEHHTRSLHLRERLASADPDNPAYQRDVWVGAYKVAGALESVRDPSAADYWSKAHRTLAALDAAGKLPDGDRQVLDRVAHKLGPR